MASRSPTVKNESISQINEGAVPANINNAAKFGWLFLQVKLGPYKPKFIDETGQNAFGFNVNANIS